MSQYALIGLLGQRIKHLYCKNTATQRKWHLSCVRNMVYYLRYIEFQTGGGCWFCPNAKDRELKHLRNNHRELWGKLLELENVPDLIGYKWNMLAKTSIHDKEEQFFWEDNQINIFDYARSLETRITWCK